MIKNAAVLESILEPVFADRDFQPLFDRLADDVVLEVTISGDPRLGREVRGKRDVMAFFLNEDAVGGFGQDGPLEYSGSGDRVVVRNVETFGRKTGIRARGRESAAVVDFRDGRIIRFLVIQDAIPTLVTTRKYGQ
jgi:ketosteroid isomerase-like protein